MNLIKFIPLATKSRSDKLLEVINSDELFGEIGQRANEGLFDLVTEKVSDELKARLTEMQFNVTETEEGVRVDWISDKEDLEDSVTSIDFSHFAKLGNLAQENNDLTRVLYDLLVNMLVNDRVLLMSQPEYDEGEENKDEQLIGFYSSLGYYVYTAETKNDGTVWVISANKVEDPSDEDDDGEELCRHEDDLSNQGSDSGSSSSD